MSYLLPCHCDGLQVAPGIHEKSECHDATEVTDTSGSSDDGTAPVTLKFGKAKRDSQHCQIGIGPSARGLLPVTYTISRQEGRKEGSKCYPRDAVGLGLLQSPLRRRAQAEDTRRKRKERKKEREKKKKRKRIKVLSARGVASVVSLGFPPIAYAK